MDIEAILQELAVKRPVFHSEADFQYALAWEIHKVDEDGIVRLEYKHPAATTTTTATTATNADTAKERSYTDIWYEGREQHIAIELKYCTKNYIWQDERKTPTEKFKLSG